MIAADTSVIVAAFASWHADHEAASTAIDGSVRLIAHCAVETYSVLTRLPTPHRAPARLVGDFLEARFPSPTLAIPPDGAVGLIRRLADLGITGGAAYDALVAVTAASAGADLLSCDRRALTVYQRCGVRVVTLG